MSLPGESNGQGRPPDDISDKGSVEAALPQGEEHFWAAIKDSRAGYFFADTRACLRDCNEACMRMLGYDARDELIGRRLHEIWFDEDSPELHRLIDHVLQRQSVESGEARYRRKDGTVGHCTFTAGPVVREGTVLGVEGFIIDLSRRAEAEEEMRRSWQQLRTIVDAIPVPMLISRQADGRILHANSLVEATFGMPAGTAVGRKTTDFYADLAVREVLLAEIRKNGRVRDAEVRAVKSDGTPFWVIASLEPTVFDGEPALLSSFYDITSRKTAEEALRRSELKYRFLVDHLPAGVVVHAPDSSIILSNAEAARLLGLSREQMVGKTLAQHRLQLTRADGSPMPVEEYPVNRVIATGQPVHGCIVGGVDMPSKGDRSWVMLEAFPEFDSRGRLQQVIVLFLDITRWRHDEQALIASERLFRSLAETAPVGITIVQDGVLRYVNPTVTRLMGYTTEEMVGQSPFSFIHPEMREEANRRSQSRAQGSEEATRFEMRILTKDGHELWVDQSVAIIEYEGKYATLGAALDVTHRKQMEAQLRETQERYQTLVENIELGINLIDKDYTVVMINAAEGRMLKVSPDQAAGMKCYRLFENVEAVCAHCPGTVAMRTGRPAEVDAEGVRADGTRFSSRVRAFPMKGPDGSATGFIEVVEDITRRKVAEQAITASEAKYRTLVEQLPAIIYTTPPHAGPGTDYISPYMERILGYLPEEFTRNPDMWRDHIHADDRERVLGDLERAIAQDEPYASEYRMIAHDGRVVWFRDEARLIRDADGAPLFLQGVMMDISERKRTEEELRIGRQKLKDIIEGSHIGTWDWNVQTGATVFDERWAEIVGYTTEDLRPMTFQTWADLVHPDDLIKATVLIQRHFAGELDYYACEHRMKHKDGSWVWVSARGRMTERTDNGKPLRMMGTHADITARKRIEQAITESEAKYRTLVERIPAIIYISPPDRPSATSYVNSCVERILGYKPAEYEKEDLWLNCLHPEDKDRVLAELSKSVAEGTIFVSEYRMFASDGRIVWLHDEASAVRDRDGTPLFLQGVMLDITEQKQADAELRKFKAISDRIMLGTAIIDMQDRVCYVNEAQARMHGYTPQELIGKHVSIFHPPSVVPEVNRRIEMIKRTGRATGMEVLHQRRDGTVFPTLMDSTVIADEKGNPCFVAGVAADISELKRVEIELRKFKTIADETSHGQSILDLDGKILYVNDAFARMHGWAPEELLGKDVSVYHSPEQMVEVNRLLEGLKSGGGRFMNEEVWHVRKDGTTFPTIMDAVVISDDRGTPLFLSGMMIDITERKQIEAALRRQALVFDNINDGVIITNAGGLITNWNPGAERIFDYLKHEVVGRHPEMLNRPEDAKVITRSIQEGLARDGYWSGEVDFVRKDGSGGVCEVFVVPLRDEKQQLIGRIAVNRDITARKQAEEEKARLEAQLHQAQKMEAVGTLAGGVAHDFNNLLTAIFGYTDLAKTSLPGEHPAIRSLEMVEQAGRQARGVINSLLTFSQKDTPEKAPVDLTVSLVETVGLLRRLLPAAIEIEEDMPAGGEVWVNADATQLQQVWMNLAVNARDAMKRGGRLRVSLRESSEAQPGGGPWPDAVVVVEDTGTGMSAEVKSRIFEPFFTTKPRGQGTGLGLSVTHAIIANHGGRMEIESQPGEGTRVSIFLPRCDPPPKEARAASRARRRAGRGESILVVEDDDQVRSILVSALRSQSYEVAVAADSAEAQFMLKKRHNALDMIVMDLDLPKTSGMALLRKIRRALPDVPILIVTGTVGADAREDPERKQFLLRKPFQVAELVEEVAKVFARSLRRKEGCP